MIKCESTSLEETLCHQPFTVNQFTGSVGAEQKMSSSPGKVEIKDPFLGFGTVLPPWLLLAWMRRMSRKGDRSQPTEVAQLMRSVGCPVWATLSEDSLPNDCHHRAADTDYPLDLRVKIPLKKERCAAAFALYANHVSTDLNFPWSGGNLEDSGDQFIDNMRTNFKGEESNGNRLHIESNHECLNSLNQPIRLGQNTTTERSSFKLGQLEKPYTSSVISRAGSTPVRSRLERNRWDTSGAGSGNGPTGPGKQPVTRCFQCKILFPSLFELNTHFVMEHAMILRTELEHTKSWKSHAVEAMCLQEMDQISNRGALGSGGYPCPYCKYCAKWPTELQKHIMVHSKERPHRCVICGLSYKWKWDLGRHFDKSHHRAINPYKKNCFSSSSSSRGTRQESRNKNSLKKCASKMWPSERSKRSKFATKRNAQDFLKSGDQVLCPPSANDGYFPLLTPTEGVVLPGSNELFQLHKLKFPSMPPVWLEGDCSKDFAHRFPTGMAHPSPCSSSPMQRMFLSTLQLDPPYSD